MGRTSNKTKQDWNAGHYAQVKISVSPVLAAEFKHACAVADSSMASVLSQFMSEYCNAGAIEKTTRQYSTRGKRRALVKDLVQQLSLIMDAEETYMCNIPDNLQNSSVYDKAEQSVSQLEEAISLLESAY